MTKVKICGVTREADAAFVAGAGVEFIGLNFWPRSKRYLAPGRRAPVAAAARAGGAELVGVFVDAALDEIAAIASELALDVIQLHGDETPADAIAVAAATGRRVWKAIAITGPGDLASLASWPVEAILLDAPSAGRGGAGVAFDWNLVRDAGRTGATRLVLAGGLGPHNVAAAIAEVAPWAVDVASGVESEPGIKDPTRLAAFVAAARAASPA